MSTGSAPEQPILAIVGVTASGKSDLALHLAHEDSRVELVSIDSMQIYRGMDIGTAKPSVAQQTAVRHHMIDIVDPGDDFAVSEFQAQAKRAVADILNRGRVPVLVGGTGLHLRAVVDDLEIPGRYPGALAELTGEETELLYERLVGLDAEAASRVEPTNRRRILRALEVTIGSGRPFSSYGPGLKTYGSTPFTMIGPRWPRPVIDGRIDARYHAQVEAGFVDEVHTLANQAGGLSRTAAQALGYRQLLDHLAGKCTHDEAIDLAMAATRRFARRQERWFRRDPRIRWIDIESNPLEAMGQLMREYELCI